MVCLRIISINNLHKGEDDDDDDDDNNNNKFRAYGMLKKWKHL